jgi:hypothetical protein
MAQSLDRFGNSFCHDRQFGAEGLIGPGRCGQTHPKCKDGSDDGTAATAVCPHDQFLS